MNRRSEHLDPVEEEAIDDFVAARLGSGARQPDNAGRPHATEELDEIWDDVAAMRERPHYAELYGKPTLREHLFGALHSLQDGLRSSWARPARLGFAAACLATILAVGFYAIRPVAPHYETGIAEVRDLALEDGSRVTLGARSAIEAVAFTAEARRVRMGEGEAFFAVAKNPARPFLVQAGDTLIRVVGTRFNVKYEGARVKVSVLEGVVQVMRPGAAADTVTSASNLPHVTLTAGQQTLVTQTAPAFTATATPIQGVPPGAWREGHLAYADAELSEVIADANRYRPGRIRIASPDLGRERITASFATNQVEQMLDTLSASVGAEVERQDDGNVEIRRR